METTEKIVEAYVRKNGPDMAALLLVLSQLIEATLAVHCGNGFDAVFSPYRSTRLSR